MRAKYETLDDLDAVKEQIAEKTRDMTADEVGAYFAGAARRLRELTGQKLRFRRPGRKASTTKR